MRRGPVGGDIFTTQLIPITFGARSKKQKNPPPAQNSCTNCRTLGGKAISGRRSAARNACIRELRNGLPVEGKPLTPSPDWLDCSTSRTPKGDGRQLP